MINECGTTDGVRIEEGGKPKLLEEFRPQCKPVHHKSHTTCPGIDSRAAVVEGRPVTP
jgi:hypothetical protein